MQAYEEHVQELDRLRWIHAASQMQYVTTLAWQAKQEAMLESTRVSISRAASVQVCQTLHSGVSLQIERNESEKGTTRKTLG